MRLKVIPNVYAVPSKSGLTQVAELDYSDGCYQFDLRVVWKDVVSGRLWTARDSGCSCPSPFEYTCELDRCFLQDLYAEYRTDTKGKVSVSTWQAFFANVKTARGGK